MGRNHLHLFVVIKMKLASRLFIPTIDDLKDDRVTVMEITDDDNMPPELCEAINNLLAVIEIDNEVFYNELDGELIFHQPIPASMSNWMMLNSTYFDDSRLTYW